MSKAFLKKTFPGVKPSRPAGFVWKGQTLYITGYDVDVVLVIKGRDIEKLETCLFVMKGGRK